MQELAISDYLKETFDNQEYQKILFGVLKRLHIDYYHPERADFEQEARLVMANELTRLAHQPAEQQPTNLNLHLYQHLYWRLLDQLRRAQRHQEREPVSLDQSQEDDEKLSLTALLSDEQAGYAFETCELRQFWQRLLKELTPNQIRYLKLVASGYSQKEIAERLHISRQAVSNLRQRVICQGRKLMKEVK
ncbi:helix-turn-helix domain-containing protein [Limosilactobacillus caecicola]|uniref:helix-turn-helix domain-containing protein n=1 Tax=Limosilactobacillus caecicola TaxID=2941332 RepID=UPI00203B4FCC|nr:LuxR C-terminal-related transcriptional regulator [Limosilactobacillus caecicola]